MRESPYESNAHYWMKRIDLETILELGDMTIQISATVQRSSSVYPIENAVKSDQEWLVEVIR